MLNNFNYIEYEEDDIINRKDFDLRVDTVSFNFQGYTCSLECNNLNKIVELFMIKKNVYGEKINSKSYYMTTGYYAFVGNSKALLIYIDLVRKGYIGSVEYLQER